MPRSFFTINDFSGGLVTANEARDIADNEYSDLDNVVFDKRKSVNTMGGDTAHNDVAQSTAGSIAPGYGAFIFESDHEEGSSALDTGENWLCIADAKNVQVDLYNLKDDTVNANQIDLGTVESHGFGAGNLDIVSNSSGNDTITDDTNTVMISQNFRKGDLIALTGASNTQNNINAGSIKNLTTSVMTLDQGGLLTTQADDGNDVTITKLFTAVYYFADESLRVADASMGANIQPYWYGYINRKHFEDASRVVDTYDNWFSKTNGLSAPTELTKHSTNYPSAGTGFIINFTDGNEGTGLWENIEYQFGASFIYDGNQESLIYESGTTHTPTNNDSSLTMELRAVSAFEPRISGARIYVKANADDAWTLFTDISMQHGARMSLGNTYTAWANKDGSTTTEAKVTSLVSTHPNLETYDILNGFGNDEQKITISGNGEGYKASVIANRRCFIANVKTTNDDGILTQMRDRIMYTPVGKFDTFPRSFFIDVVKGDAEEYISLQEFSDRLLAFKSRKLFIINIAQSNPSGWFLEDIKDFSGCEHLNATCKTEFGIAWVNQYGVYIYNGQAVTNLLLNKIDETTWRTFFTTNSIIGYNAKKYYLLVMKDAFASDGDVYIYDFRTQSWTKGSGAVGSQLNRTNMVSDWNGALTTVVTDKQSGDLVWNLGGGWDDYPDTDTGNRWNANSDNYSVKEWSDSPRNVGAGRFVVTTKDIDFNSPGTTKKIYAVTITYKSDNDQTTPISFATDGGTSFTNFTGDFTGTGTGFKKLRAKASSPISCQSIKFKITNSANTGTSEGIQINDISVEYRPIFKRVS